MLGQRRVGVDEDRVHGTLENAAGAAGAPPLDGSPTPSQLMTRSGLENGFWMGGRGFRPSLHASYADARRAKNAASSPALISTHSSSDIECRQARKGLASGPTR